MYSSKNKLNNKINWIFKLESNAHLKQTKERNNKGKAKMLGPGVQKDKEHWLLREIREGKKKGRVNRLIK